jgi:hypothetical protein
VGVVEAACAVVEAACAVVGAASAQVEEASPPAVACLAPVEEASPVAGPVEVALLAEAQEVDRAVEDSPRARRSVALGPVRGPALEEEQAQAVEWAAVHRHFLAKPVQERVGPPLPAARSDSAIGPLSVSRALVVNPDSAIGRALVVNPAPAPAQAVDPELEPARASVHRGSVLDQG